jgi:L-threonylcarbamoyladenylate synthase
MKKLLITQLDDACLLLKNDIPVAFPTETVYGLGAPVTQEVGIQKIFKMKGRPSDNPLICHISSLEDIHTLSKSFSFKAHQLARYFWPGPLTLGLPKHPSLSYLVTGGLETVAVRMPRHSVALELIAQYGTPLAAPSANRSGKPSSTTADHVLEDFKEEEGAVIDGGCCQEGVESTVLLLEPKPCILRPGSVTKEEIEKVLKEPISFSQGKEVNASPGTRYKHYAPNAKVTLVNSFHDVSQSENCFLMSCDKIEGMPLLNMNSLYALLRQADREGYKEIIVVLGDKIEHQPALKDRLYRAAGIL